MNDNEIQRYAITGSLLFAAWTAYTCPCKNPFLSCHVTEFALLTGLPLAFVLLINADNLPGRNSGLL
jgi:hypothetical protein